jgi:hypothetical protein
MLVLLISGTCADTAKLHSENRNTGGHAEGLRDGKRKIWICIVTYMLKVRTVVPEKQPLPANGFENIRF